MMKKTVLLLLLVVAHTSPAQTVTTVASSNVTSWAAQLHGSYDSLDTNETYELSFAYGKADGGTNLGSWSFQSSAVIVSGGSTGAYYRTVIELEGTNTYYFRGLAETTNATLWATQSLSFVTAGTAPTSTPPVQYLAVMADTNGVLVGPTNFFEANGIVPTQGVALLSFRISSNELQIIALSNGYSYIEGLVTDMIAKQATTSTFTHVEAEVFEGNELATPFSGSTNQPDTVLQGADALYAGSYAATAGAVVVKGGSGVSGQAKGGDVIIKGGDPYSGGSSGVVRLLSVHILNFSDGSSITTAPSTAYLTPSQASNLFVSVGSTNPVLLANLTVTNKFEAIAKAGTQTGGWWWRWGYHASLPYTPGYITVQDYYDVEFRAPYYQYYDRGMFYFTGPNAGGTSIQTNLVIDNTGIKAYAPIYGDLSNTTNMPVSSLRLANSYTGGVMVLKTTDGTSFFLE